MKHAFLLSCVAWGLARHRPAVAGQLSGNVCKVVCIRHTHLDMGAQGCHMHYCLVVSLRSELDRGA